MDIMLVRLSAAGDWLPLSRLAAAWRGKYTEELALVINSCDPNLPVGAGVFLKEGQTFGATLRATDVAALSRAVDRAFPQGSARSVAGALPGVDMLWLSQAPPVPILVLGAGPDAQPVVALAARLGWSVTVIDHRSHYARIERFPGAAAVLDGGAAAVENMLGGGVRISAAVVMSHHFNSDSAYLRALARSDVPYIGLLGPTARRERLLHELGPESIRLGSRLRAPVGLDLGADTPEAIALAIVAEIHAVLAGHATAGSMNL
jgi:xanthine/CO dehydrogenase XdhC/CoxF family maturation factor